MLGSWNQGRDYAPAVAVHTGVRVPQVDPIEDIKDVGPKTQIGALGHGNGLGYRNIALEKAGPSKGITANISDLACTGALPGTHRWSLNRLAIGINATKSWGERRTVASLQSYTSGGSEVLLPSTGDLDGSDTIRTAGIAGVSIGGAKALGV